MQQQLIE
jgi:hypothetical protein